jgi:hypothetical protein
MSQADDQPKFRAARLMPRLLLWGAAFTGLAAAPALAMGGMGFGGFHGGFRGGGFHGGFHGGGFHAPPPPANVPAPFPPVGAPPPNRHIHTGFVTVHFPHDHFFHDHGHGQRGNGAFWGWPGGGYGVYASGGGEPVYVAQETAARASEPPPCPELLTWSPRLGRATRQRLCDDVG